ncbi:MAG: hypothetical protein ACJ8FS_12365 [Sphingomicrobium sp.]
MPDAAFDWIAVSFTASGSGTPFGAKDRVGAKVRVGVRMADDVREIELPVLLNDASNLTLAELRDKAVGEAVNLLRKLVSDLEGQTYDQLAARQDRQDEEREKQFEESLRSDILKEVNPPDDEDRA